MGFNSKLGRWYKKILDLSTKNKNEWNELISLIYSNIKENSNKIALLVLGDLSNSVFKDISSEFNQVFSEKNFVISRSFLETKDSDLLIVLTTDGLVGKKDIIDLKTKISLIPNRNIYWIYLNTN